LRYTFEWDPNKARSNLQKHKVSFDRAAEIFLDPLAISIFGSGYMLTDSAWLKPPP
jgi:hypothetical protein